MPKEVFVCNGEKRKVPPLPIPAKIRYVKGQMDIQMVRRQDTRKMSMQMLNHGEISVSRQNIASPSAIKVELDTLPSNLAVWRRSL